MDLSAIGSVAVAEPTTSSSDRTRPLTGNEAIARGAWEAGVKVAAAYPGTPSTEIMESLAGYPVEDLHAQWSTNEKVAMDVTFGASVAGVRSITAMKHVGLNVASDALMSLTYIGVNAGFVIVVCDDPGIHSSQNEQDTRLLGRMAYVPVLEPSDATEALAFTRSAFAISEQFDTPVIVRSTTRLSHTRNTVLLGERVEAPAREFLDAPTKSIMIPSHARIRHPLMLERETRLAAYLETSDLNRIDAGDTTFGVITLSTAYTYVKEVCPSAHVLKLGASYPLPLELIRTFCADHQRVFVVEELEPVIEKEILAAGIAVEGKQWFPRVGELSPELVREGLSKAGVIAAPMRAATAPAESIARPPVLCAGCPHTSSYMAIRALNAHVAGDIGCYTLGAIEPLRAIDTTVSMGSSIANAVGMAKSGNTSKPVMATIGDSTFLHAGIPPLIDAVYNNADITVVLLDNEVVAMTGGQDHPGTGRTLRGEQTHRADYQTLCAAIGVKWVRKVDPYDMGSLYRTIREATEHPGVAVVIANRPCVLDPVRIRGPALHVVAENCVACQACMNLGCPALVWTDEIYDGHRKVRIDESTCIGCSLCAQICPSDCIRTLES